MISLSRLTLSELRVMKLLWEQGEMSASQLAGALKKQIGWHPNTTYTTINKCVAKGFVQRLAPNYGCRALFTREQVRREAVGTLLDTVYGGDVDLLVEDIIGPGGLLDTLSAEQAPPAGETPSAGQAP